METIEELQRTLVVAIETEKNKLKKEKEELQKEKQEWKLNCQKLEKVQVGRVKLDVGGQIFATSESTLSNKKSGFFSAMFSGRWSINKEEDGSIFIDRDPLIFGHILNYLRGEEFPISKMGQIELERLKKDKEFYQIDSQELIEVERDSFDPLSCGPGIQLSENNLTATSAMRGYCSVVSCKGYQKGIHIWKVRTDHFPIPSQWIAIGIAHKEQLSKSIDYISSYSLSSTNQKCAPSLTTTTTASSDWKDGDIIDVILDCSQNKLTVKNLRTSRGENWVLPSDGINWYLYIYMHNPANQVTMII